MKSRDVLLLVSIASLLFSCTLPNPALPANDDAIDASVEVFLVDWQTRGNLASGQPVTASSYQSGHEPALVVDGQTGYANTWVSEGGTPQWVQIDLGGDTEISSIELLVSQPRGEVTQHDIYGISADGDEQLLHTFEERTENNGVLAFTPDIPWSGYRYIRIETLSTPSLSAWQEIQVFGQRLDLTVSNTAQVVLHNGMVLSMDARLGEATAIAIADGLILAVGTDADMLALAAENTRIIDLEGRTILPGFVDSHSHVFGDPGVIGETHDTIQDRLFSEGITTITEMGGDADFVAWTRDLETEGALRIRLSIYPNITTNCGEYLGDDYLAVPREVNPETKVDVPGLKGFADGGSCAAPAVSFQYANNVGQGDLFFTQEEMNALVAEANDRGYQIALHALGDRAVEQVLNAFITVNGADNDPHNRIEHNAVVRPEIYALYSQANPVATFFGYSAACIWSGEPSKFAYAVPEAYADWEWPYGRLLDANPGLIAAWHGDVPVFPLSTIENLFGLVTRRQVSPDGGLCQPPDWMLADTVSTQAALEMMTINAAYALGRDESIGSLTPGKLADLIILSDNPLALEPSELLNLNILVTIVGGMTEFCAAGAEAYCP
jgi:hypothetical protein